jgi:hypothetical protein
MEVVRRPSIKGFEPYRPPRHRRSCPIGSAISFNSSRTTLFNAAAVSTRWLRRCTSLRAAGWWIGQGRKQHERATATMGGVVIFIVVLVGTFVALNLQNNVGEVARSRLCVRPLPARGAWCFWGSWMIAIRFARSQAAGADGRGDRGGFAGFSRAGGDAAGV